VNALACGVVYGRHYEVLGPGVYVHVHGSYVIARARPSRRGK
jgi:hypothetical protein